MATADPKRMMTAFELQFLAFCNNRGSESKGPVKDGSDKEEGYNCELCLSTPTLKFKTEAELEDHIDGTHTERNCEICGKIFPNKIYYKAHSNEPKYVCRVEKSKFCSQDALESHRISVHSGEGIIECEICGKKFLRRAQLDSHVDQTHSSKRTVIDKGRGSSRCEVCDKVFPTKQDLSAHLRDTHVHDIVSNGNNRFHCEFCDEVFTLNHIRKRHQNKYHGQLKCGSCSRSFVEQSDLEKHLRKKIHGTDIKEAEEEPFKNKRASGRTKRRTKYTEESSSPSLPSSASESEEEIKSNDDLEKTALTNIQSQQRNFVSTKPSENYLLSPMKNERKKKNNDKVFPKGRRTGLSTGDLEEDDDDDDDNDPDFDDNDLDGAEDDYDEEEKTSSKIPVTRRRGRRRRLSSPPEMANPAKVEFEDLEAELAASQINAKPCVEKKTSVPLSRGLSFASDEEDLEADLKASEVVLVSSMTSDTMANTRKSDNEPKITPPPKKRKRNPDEFLEADDRNLPEKEQGKTRRSSLRKVPRMSFQVFEEDSDSSDPELDYILPKEKPQLEPKAKKDSKDENQQTDNNDKIQKEVENDKETKVKNMNKVQSTSERDLREVTQNGDVSLKLSSENFDEEDEDDDFICSKADLEKLKLLRLSLPSSSVQATPKTESVPVKPKMGRPKGSKNKPKKIVVGSPSVTSKPVTEKAKRRKSQSSQEGSEGDDEKINAVKKPGREGIQRRISALVSEQVSSVIIETSSSSSPPSSRVSTPDSGFRRSTSARGRRKN